MKEEISQSKFLGQVISLKSKHKKVKVYPMLNSSFLLCKSLSLESVQQIQQFSLQKNKVVYQTYLPRGALFEVIEDSHLVIMNISKNVMDIYSLKTGQITSIQYQFMNRSQVDLKVFQKTKIFCVAERRHFTAKITFYSYENSKVWMGSFFFKEIKCETNINREQNKTQFVQLDDESKIALVQSNPRQISLQISSFEFDQGQIDRQNWETIKVDLSSVSCLKDIGYFEKQQTSTINVVWEFQKKQFLAIAKMFGQPYYFILQTFDPKNAKIVPLELTFYNDPFDVSTMELIYKDFRGLTVFRDRKSNRHMFADLKKRKIVDFDFGWDKVTGTSPRLKDGKIFIEINSDPGRLLIKMTDWTIETKSVFLHLLLELNEDFDDDLLQDSIDLLF